MIRLWRSSRRSRHSGGVEPSGHVQGFPHRLEERPTKAALIDALSSHLEIRLRQRLNAADRRKPLGLATGRTMEPLYASLVQRLSAWDPSDLAALRASWCSFNLDEYLGLPAADPRSYRHFMEAHLGGPLRLLDASLQLPDGTAENAETAAEQYRTALHAAGGIGLQLLGLGSNGHVGFNEPPCGPRTSCRVVTLSGSTREQNAGMFGGDSAAVPTRAITLGLQEILMADDIHLVVTGASKAPILRSLLTLEEPDERLPASWLGNHRQVCLWADAEALQHL